MQEVGLVLVAVNAAQQACCAVLITSYAGIVSRSQVIRSQRFGLGQKLAELDLPVAHNVGIRGSAAAVLVEEVTEHLIIILAFEVDRIIRDADLLADSAYIVRVLIRGADAVPRPYHPSSS